MDTREFYVKCPDPECFRSFPRILDDCFSCEKGEIYVACEGENCDKMHEITVKLKRIDCGSCNCSFVPDYGVFTFMNNRLRNMITTPSSHSFSQ